jgi:hypothetical protein
VQLGAFGFGREHPAGACGRLLGRSFAFDIETTRNHIGEAHVRGLFENYFFCSCSWSFLLGFWPILL